METSKNTVCLYGFCGVTTDKVFRRDHAVHGFAHTEVVGP